MAMINEQGQSYLEIEAIKARKEQEARNDYNPNNEYSEQHEDALSTGDVRGKGTGDFGGPGWSVPDMTKPKSQIGSGGFNTDEGGNNCDISARETMMARCLYGPGREYGLDIVVDTAQNRADGQYDGAEVTRLPYTCPVV